MFTWNKSWAEYDVIRLLIVSHIHVPMGKNRLSTIYVMTSMPLFFYAFRIQSASSFQALFLAATVIALLWLDNHNHTHK